MKATNITRNRKDIIFKKMSELFKNELKEAIRMTKIGASLFEEGVEKE